MNRSTIAVVLAALSLTISLGLAVVLSQITGQLGVTNFSSIELDDSSSGAVLDIDQTGAGPLLVIRKAGTPMVVVNATGVPIVAQAVITMTPTPTRTPTATATATITPTATATP